MKILKPKDVSKILNVTVKTLQNWDNLNKLKSFRNIKTNRRYYIEFLKQYSNAKGYIISEIITDIGSGLNFKRKNWNKLLEMAQNREISKIIIAHKDRFTRFGYEWFEDFLKVFGVDLEIVNNEKLSPEEELVQDLVSIIPVFSCRIYGLRKYKKEIEKEISVKKL